MRIIAECNSTESEWVLVDKDSIVEKVKTKGFNPFIQSRREISHTMRLELPESFFKRRWECVHIYGSGCSTSERKKIVELSAVAQFKSPTIVESNLLGAARGLLGDKAGIACILSAGSNSCQYNGSEIEKQVRSLGFILGDEGSGSSLGRLLLSDCLKGLLPRGISEAFYDKYNITPEGVLENIFSNKSVHNWLSQYAVFLSEHLDDEYVNKLVRDEFKRFFVRNIYQYEYEKYSVNIVGDVACIFEETIRSVAQELGVEIGNIKVSSIGGLVKYHSQEK